MDPWLTEVRGALPRGRYHFQVFRLQGPEQLRHTQQNKTRHGEGPVLITLTALP